MNNWDQTIRQLAKKYSANFWMRRRFVRALYASVIYQCADGLVVNSELFRAAYWGKSVQFDDCN